MRDASHETRQMRRSIGSMSVWVGPNGRKRSSSSSIGNVLHAKSRLGRRANFQGKNNYDNTPLPLSALCTANGPQSRSRPGWGRIPFGSKRMGLDEVLGSREVLGVVPIDGALLRQAHYGPEDFK